MIPGNKTTVKLVSDGAQLRTERAWRRRSPVFKDLEPRKGAGHEEKRWAKEQVSISAD